MSNDEIVEVEVETAFTPTEPDSSSTEIDVEEGDDNTSSQKSKNDSNFKNLYKSNKEKERALAEKEALIAEQARELKEWRELNPDIAQEKSSSKSNEALELKVFGLENPEAKEHLSKVKEASNLYGLPFEKAWTLVKAELPKPSESTSDFNLNSSSVKVKKSIKDITAEEALKLPPAQQSAWRKHHLGVE